MANLWGSLFNAAGGGALQAASNLFGAHTGNWGTPDFGITEAIQRTVAPSAPMTQQGGSNLFGGGSTPVTNNNNNNSTTNSNLYGPWLPQGQVLGSQAPQGGGGNGGGGTNGSGGAGNPTFDYSSVSDSDLNNAYQGAYAALDAQQAALQGQQPLTESNIRQMGEQQKAPINERLVTGQQDLNNQRTQTQQQQANAIQQARQLFNELSQYNNARFGSGNSAGQAAMELLGRSTNQSVGQANDLATQNLGKIQDAWNNLSDYVTKTKKSIDDQVSQKIQEADAWYRDQLNQINASRVGLESDKAAKRYQALQDRSNFINQINAQQYQYQLQLKNWADAQASNYAQAASQYVVPTTSADNLIASAQNAMQNAPIEQRGSLTPPLGTVNTRAQQFGGYAPGMRYRPLTNGLYVDVSTGAVVTPDQIQQ